MKIQLNTDNNIQSTEVLKKYVSEKVNAAFKHYAEKITRIELHLSDQNAEKGGLDDIQCKIEARVEGKQPVIVASKSNSKEIALDEALDKMKARLGTMIGKMRNK